MFVEQPLALPGSDNYIVYRDERGEYHIRRCNTLYKGMNSKVYTFGRLCGAIEEFKYHYDNIRGNKSQ